MKTNKNTRSRTKKTTITSLITSLNRWYGPHWWLSGLTMVTIFSLAVIIPGILG